MCGKTTEDSTDQYSWHIEESRAMELMMETIGL